jgi:uncharacterized protein (TIGR00299 family) protein
MRLAYFDCFSGISGDMALGALVHAGADLAAITEALGTLAIEDYAVETEDVDLRGISAVRVHLRTGPQSVIRTYAGIRALLDQTDLPAEVRRTAQRVYRRLADAAAVVHGKDPEQVTFHEFGERDCLVEVVGCAMALHLLEVDRVFASPVPTGMGMVRTEHGMMPIPSPVVMELLQGVPTYSRGVPVELVTATGAAILAAVSEGYGDMPMMRADHVGYGAGHLRLDFPNAVRVVIGQEQRAGAGVSGGAPRLADIVADSDVLIQAVATELRGGERDRLIDALIHAGAIDAWAGAATGPKGRARTTISVVVSPGAREAVLGALRAGGVGDVRLLPVLASLR